MGDSNLEEYPALVVTYKVSDCGYEYWKELNHLDIEEYVDVLEGIKKMVDICLDELLE